MGRTSWNPKLEARRAALEAEATALLRVDTRRQQAAERSKLKLKAKASPSPLTPVGWVPLADLARAMRSKNSGNERTGK